MDTKTVLQKLPLITDKIVKEFKPEQIILFGSFAWGTPGPDSDLDLFVVKKTNQGRIERGQDMERLLWGTGMPIDVLIYTPQEVEKRLRIKDFFVENIFTKGKILYPSDS